ncbi:trypsin-like serine peptidase [Streptodolium elevatio]|uniref:Peptidase n=1 Tax=Streptodolium elevatio TaxID=3157996 RepID=A0ABV3DUE7_9ACTN
MPVRSTLRRKIATILGVLSLAGGALVTVPSAAQAAGDAPVEIRRLVPAGADHAAVLQSNVNYWNVARIAEWGLNAGGADAYAPPGGWDDLSKPWVGPGAISRTAGKMLMQYRNTWNGAITHSACSANVIKAANQSTIVTAGHCVKIMGQMTGQVWGDSVVVNAVFIPGFNGAAVPRNTPGTDPTTAPLPGADIAPYGVWGLTRVWATPTWDADSTFRSGGDVAMATVERPGDPTPIQQVVGGQDIAFGVEAHPLTLHQFGYPVDNGRNWYWTKNNDGTYGHDYGVDPSLWRGFDGRSLMYARGSTIPDATLGTLGHDMPSAMAPGSSGGPWLMNFDSATGTGTQVAVTSRFTNSSGNSPWWDAIWGQVPAGSSNPNWAFGPYSVGNGFGALTQAMYNVVQNATP